jgi:hypothetical protein
MVRSSTAARLAPLVAGLAGLAWFWFELTPQQAGFEDTDNPATGLQFIAAFPGAWVSAGLALAIAAIALVATVVAVRDRLESAPEPNGIGVAVRTVSTLGLFAAFMLLGQAVTRLAGGPVAYVQGLDQEWGEAAYLVTQFVGIQLFGVGGMALFALWAVGVSWLGARRGVIPRPVAILALVPGFRLVAILALLGILPVIDGLWLVYMASIPGAFLWLVLLGAWPAATPRSAAQAAAAPAGL